MLSSILQFSKVSPLFYNLKKSFEKILLLKKVVKCRVFIGNISRFW